MRYAVLIPTFAVAFVLQLTVLNLFTINGIVPSLILCLVLIITFLFDREDRVILVGTVTGLLLDMVTGHYTGIYALTLFLIGSATIAYKYFANSDSRLSLIPLCIGGVALYHIIPAVILKLAGSGVSIFRILGFMPISILYNFAVLYVMYMVLIRSVNKRPKRSRYERYEII